MAFVAPTKASLQRSRRPLAQLPEFQELRRAVSCLQKDSREQLTLEQESQSTFEFLAGQVKALRSAFAVLSDVVVEEVDSLRKEVRAARRETTELRGDLTQVAQAHAGTAEWAAGAERDLGALRERVGEGLDTLDRRTARQETALEQAGTRLSGLAEKIGRTEAAQHEGQRQRLQDLELTQHALEACQRNQAHTDEALHALAARAARLEALAGEMGEAMGGQQGELREVAAMVETLQATVEALQRAFSASRAAHG